MEKKDTADLENRIPIHEVWDKVLMLPIYGIVDSKKGQDIMEAILQKVVATKSSVIILDILGVATVDSAVANHLIKITKATRLMGADCIISGISPAIAQTIVSLGIELGEVKTNATLKDALAAAFQLANLKIVAIGEG